MSPERRSTNTNKYTLSELLDLALRVPEIGAVNFNILHTVIKTIIEKVNLESVRPLCNIESSIIQTAEQKGAEVKSSKPKKSSPAESEIAQKQHRRKGRKKHLQEFKEKVSLPIEKLVLAHSDLVPVGRTEKPQDEKHEQEKQKPVVVTPEKSEDDERKQKKRKPIAVEPKEPQDKYDQEQQKPIAVRTKESQDEYDQEQQEPIIVEPQRPEDEKGGMEKTQKDEHKQEKQKAGILKKTQDDDHEQQKSVILGVEKPQDVEQKPGKQKSFIAEHVHQDYFAEPSKSSDGRRMTDAWKLTVIDDRILATEEGLSKITFAFDRLSKQFDHQVSRVNRLEEESRHHSPRTPGRGGEMLVPASEQMEEMKVRIENLEKTQLNISDFSIEVEKALEMDKAEVLDIVENKIAALDAALREFFERAATEGVARGIGAATKILQEKEKEREIISVMKWGQDKTSEKRFGVKKSSEEQLDGEKSSEKQLDGEKSSEMQLDGEKSSGRQIAGEPSADKRYETQSQGILESEPSSPAQQSVQGFKPSDSKVPLISSPGVPLQSFSPSQLKRYQVSPLSPSSRSPEVREVEQPGQKDHTHVVHNIIPRAFTSDLNQRFGDVWEEISRMSDMIASISVDEEIQVKAVTLQRTIRKLKDTIETMQRRVDYLETEGRVRHAKVEWMFETLEELKTGKIDRNEFEEMLILKANKRDLEDKINRPEFECNLEEICEVVRIAVEKVAKVGQQFETTKGDVYDKLEKKLNIDDHDALLKPLWNRLRNLMHGFAKIKSIIFTSLYPEAGAVTKCVCCGRMAELAGTELLDDYVDKEDTSQQPPMDTITMADIKPISSGGTRKHPSPLLSIPKGSAKGSSLGKDFNVPYIDSRYVVRKRRPLSKADSYAASIKEIVPQLDRVLEACERTVKLKCALNSPMISPANDSEKSSNHSKEGLSQPSEGSGSIEALVKEAINMNFEERSSLADHQRKTAAGVSKPGEETQPQRKFSISTDERNIGPIGLGTSGPRLKTESPKRFSISKTVSHSKSVGSRPKVLRPSVISIPFDVQLKDGSVHHPDVSDSHENLLNRVPEDQSPKASNL